MDLRVVTKYLSKYKREVFITSILLKDSEDLIKISYLPTIEQLCEQEDITQEELPRVIGQKIENVLGEMQRTSQSDYLSPDLLFVGQCFRALEKVEVTDSDTLIELKNSLASFESFRESYLDDTSLDPPKLAKFRFWVTEVCRKIYPSEVLRFKKGEWGLPKSRNRQLSCADREEADRMSWMKYKDTKASTIYVTERVLKDAASINKEEVKGYFHSTSSSVFKGLIQHKALLSRDRLKEREQEVLTSEGHDYERCIYVDNGFNHGYQYSKVVWFNEYSVTFLIDPKKQQGSPAIDWGISLGKEVPIEHIKMMFVPSRNMDEAKKWAEENMPWSTVHAIESEYLLENYY